MGTDAHLIVEGDDAPVLLDDALEHLRRLEQQWSRFVPASDISRLNRSAGQPTIVGADTLELVRTGVLGWTLTGGRFDPTVLTRLVELGYDRSYEPDMTTRRVPTRSAGTAGCAGIDIDAEASTVRLPLGVAFDPGGIGKGLAADLVSEAIIARGADRVVVNVGGDLRVRSRTRADAWPVAIREPELAADVITVVGITDGALATSTTLRRRWTAPGGEHHHLIDPDTGMPYADGPVVASAIAGEGWWAEVVATASMAPIGQQRTAAVERCPTLRILDDGCVIRSGGFERYEL